MSPVLYNCPCLGQLSVSRPPPSEPPLSSFVHHELSSLLFCEECDAIRCDTCVAGEISCYYCPNCLFEVPSASVRGEKNRCARSCFQCPHCDNGLTVIGSDPAGESDLASAAASIGEAPFSLSCSVCKWNSTEVGIVFDKATTLGLQLQKMETVPLEKLEFDHLKDHFEPFLRRGLSQSSSSLPSTSQAPSFPISPILSKDSIANLGPRYGSLFGLPSRGRSGPEAKGVKDELEGYVAVTAAGLGAEREIEKVKMMREMTSVEEVSSVQQRWNSSWPGSIKAADLKPLRTPLQSKRTKRCPACKHILIKPEQKASSTRFKIKLVASNYLPSIDLYRRPPPTIGSRLNAISSGTVSSMRRAPRTAIGRSANDTNSEDEPLRPGRTYVYELSFTNPLYDPIHVKLAVARPSAHPSPSVVENALPPQPPYAVNLPSASFPISAFAEMWEYDDEEEKDGMDEEEDGRGKKRKGKGLPGVVERKANRTTVMMEVTVAKDTVGPIRANMLVTYIYQTDDVDISASPTKSPKKGGPEKDDIKSFTFWTLFYLGTVQPRAESSRSRSTIQPGTPRVAEPSE